MEITKRHYKILLVVFVALPLMIIASSVWFLRSNSRIQAELEQLDDVQAEIVDQESIDESVVQSIDDILLEANGSYIKTRASLLSGYTLAIQNDSSASIEKYQQLLSRNKRDYSRAIAYYNLGVLAEDNGDLNEANEYFQLVIDLDAYDRLALKARAHYNIARNLEQVGDIEDAIDMYQRVIDQYPDSIWVALATNRLIVLL